jgi:hypothetical protein
MLQFAMDDKSAPEKRLPYWYSVINFIIYKKNYVKNMQYTEISIRSKFKKFS